MPATITRTTTGATELALHFTDGDGRNTTKRGTLVASIAGGRATLSLSHIATDGLRLDRDEMLRAAEFLVRCASEFAR